MNVPAYFSDPHHQDRVRIIRRIADAVGAAECKFCRATGMGWTDSYLIGWAEADQAYRMLSAEDRPAVLTTFRPMEKTS